jgi:uncharacterized membrane protein YkoI
MPGRGEACLAPTPPLIFISERSATFGAVLTPKEENVMHGRIAKLGVGAALVAALAGGGAAWATAGGGDNDKPLVGSALDKATAAALAQVGGGTVTETEVGDDGAAYGVEVRLDDGSQVEVNLDANFNVIGQAADDDGPNDQDGANDDD